MSLLSTVVAILAFWLAASAVHATLIYRDYGVKGLRDRDPVLGDNVVLSKGCLRSGDEQFHNRTDVVKAVANKPVSISVRFESNNYRTMWYILVTELGESQNVTASIIRGELGTSAVTIKYQSEVGRGINVLTQIYGLVKIL